MKSGAWKKRHAIETESLRILTIDLQQQCVNLARERDHLHVSCDKWHHCAVDTERQSGELTARIFAQKTFLSMERETSRELLEKVSSLSQLLEEELRMFSISKGKMQTTSIKLAPFSNATTT